MSKNFKFKCDFCGDETEAKYNGETYLPPKSWRRLYDHNQGEVIENSDMCEKCVPALLKNKTKIEAK